MFPVLEVYLRSFFQGAKALPVDKIMFPHIEPLDKEEKEMRSAIPSMDILICLAAITK